MKADSMQVRICIVELLVSPTPTTHGSAWHPQSFFLNIGQCFLLLAVRGGIAR